MAFKFQMNKTAASLIFYKLLVDSLFLCLLFFGLALIADGMIPGIVTDHVSFLKIIFFIFFILSAAYIFGSFAKIRFNDFSRNKKGALFLAALSALIIFNGLYKLNTILALFIMLGAGISGYFIYKNVLGNE